MISGRKCIFLDFHKPFPDGKSLAGIKSVPGRLESGLFAGIKIDSDWSTALLVRFSGIPPGRAEEKAGLVYLVREVGCEIHFRYSFSSRRGEIPQLRGNSIELWLLFAFVGPYPRF